MAKINYRADVDLNENQLLQVVLENLNGSPTTIKGGRLFYLTTDKVIKYYDGEVWQTLVTGTNLGNYQLTSQKGQASGYAGLDSATKVPISQILTGNTTGTLVLLKGTVADGQGIKYSSASEGFVSYEYGIIYKYKGSDTYENIVALTGMGAGDTWNSTTANGNYPIGTNYAWNGTEWDALGGSVDLSGYLTANGVITAGTKCKITYDEKGLVTGGDNLEATDIPNLPSDKITSGTLDIARLPTGNANNKVPLLIEAGSAGQGIKLNSGATAFEFFTPPAKYIGTITGNGSAVSWTITHNLGDIPTVLIIDSSTGEKVEMAVILTTTTCVASVNTAPAIGTNYTVILLG
ncbi:MAG: hypothetical protein WCS15_11695 [Prevotella sp.]